MLFFCTSYCLLHILLFFAHLIVLHFFYFIAHFTLISPFLTICMPLCYVTLYNLYSYYFALSTERTRFDYISLLIIPCITIMWQIKKPWNLETLDVCWVISRGQQIYTVTQAVDSLLYIEAKCHFFSVVTWKYIIKYLQKCEGLYSLLWDTVFLFYLPVCKHSAVLMFKRVHLHCSIVNVQIFSEVVSNIWSCLFGS